MANLIVHHRICSNNCITHNVAHAKLIVNVSLILLCLNVSDDDVDYTIST